MVMKDNFHQNYISNLSQKIQTEPNLRSLCVSEREGSSMRYLRRRALTTLSTSQNTDVKSEIREPQTLGWRRQETNAEFLAQTNGRKVGREQEGKK